MSTASGPLRILTVCTGNTCRSPMAEGILRARLAAADIDADVASVGTLGWGERGATPHAVTVMEELGVDLSAHRSRRLETAHLDVDLVIAMTRIHAGAVIARDKATHESVFLPSELVRLLRGVAATPEEATLDTIRQLGAARRGPAIGRAADEIADPAGEPLDVYRATATRLDRELTALVELLRA